MAESVYARRGERLRVRMAAEGIDTLLVFSGVNLRYLTGFSGGEGAVVVGSNETLLLSDSRYVLQAKEEVRAARFLEVNDPLPTELSGLLGERAGTVGVEAGSVTLAAWEELEPGLAGRDWSLAEGLVEELRQVKDEAEIACLREAGAMAAASLEFLTALEVEGRSEIDVALELEFYIRRRGSEGVPFAFIVAAGPRGAKPHALPSAEPLKQGDLLVVDFGAVVNGYASDMTRTFAVGVLDDDQVRMHQAVRDAQQAAVAAVRAGARCADIDLVARRYLEDLGVVGVFQHSVGHGVGLEVHEGPRLNQKSEEVLEAGAVITVEPGVYVPGVGGVRIEDMLVVTEGGCEVLTEWERGVVTLR